MSIITKEKIQKIVKEEISKELRIWGRKRSFT